MSDTTQNPDVTNKFEAQEGRINPVEGAHKSLEKAREGLDSLNSFDKVNVAKLDTNFELDVYKDFAGRMLGEDAQDFDAAVKNLKKKALNRVGEL